MQLLHSTPEPELEALTAILTLWRLQRVRRCNALALLCTTTISQCSVVFLMRTVLEAFQYLPSAQEN